MTWMIYGAYGYTGELCAEEALRRGERPVLAGRRSDAVEALGRRLGLPTRAFALDDPAGVDAGLEGVSAVLHCAGPFSATSAPMIDGCVRKGLHYLDITGEVEVFEAVHNAAARWKEAGIVAMPGVGFDVVPSDCLALSLKQALPQATSLELAFTTRGRPSPGTAKTMTEALGKPTLTRSDGKLVPHRAGKLRRRIDFGEGEVSAAAIKWGDITTALHSTGIPNITVYMGLPERVIDSMTRSDRFGFLLRTAPAQWLIKRRITRSVHGPSTEMREQTPTLLWGRATAPSGEVAEARLRTPNGYTLTAVAGVDIAMRVASGAVKPGAWTPGKAFGADLVLGYEGVDQEGPTVSG